MATRYEGSSDQDIWLGWVTERIPGMAKIRVHFLVYATIFLVTY